VLDYAKLAESMEMWTYLGFEPWEHHASEAWMTGVRRRVTLVKSSVIGVIAKYYAWDYVVWSHENAAAYLFKKWEPMPDVVTQRFLLMGAPPKRRSRSFCLGLKGFLEIYGYTPGDDFHPKVKDLIPAVDMAWEKTQN
jgi:hypothetical protein